MGTKVYSPPPPDLATLSNALTETAVYSAGHQSFKRSVIGHNDGLNPTTIIALAVIAYKHARRMVRNQM